MANKVTTNPFIPPFVGSSLADVSGWAGALVNALAQLFTQLGTRANASLPEDGSEPMTGPLRVATYTYATRPSTLINGMIFRISDATTNTWGATVSAGGGSDNILCWYNGTAITVVGK